MKILLPLAALALASAAVLSGCASSPEKSAAVQTASAHTVTIAVDGMVCNFCATNIDKTLAKLPGVTAVYVNLDAGSVLLGVNDPALPSDADIRKTVDDAGFAVTSIKRAAGDFAAERTAMKEKTLKNL